jgi:hypothetical protein
MRTLAAALLAASAALAQAPPPILANPSGLGAKKEFPEEGVTLRPVEGALAVASDGPDGQRVINTSRAVRIGGREEPLDLQVEVIRDLDFDIWRSIAERAQKARGFEAVTRDEAVRYGCPAWRAELPGPSGQPAVQILALDAGDRVVVVSWAAREAVAREYGALLEECAASVTPERRERAPAPRAPAIEWKPEKAGASLRYPEGWKGSERGEARALRNPTDRFENLAWGLMDGTIEARKAEWAKLKASRATAGSCLDSREETILGRKSFVFRSRLEHQGIAVLSETRLIEHRGRLVFVSMTAREDRWKAAERLLEEILGTLSLEP